MQQLRRQNGSPSWVHRARRVSMTADHLIAFFGSAIITLICSLKSMDRGVRRQQEVLAQGILTQGTVVRLWQPPLSAFRRIYFEFQPSEAQQPIRGCHVDRRSAEQSMASLPQVGAS